MEKKELGCAIEAEPKTLRGGELVNARVWFTASFVSSFLSPFKTVAKQR